MQTYQINIQIKSLLVYSKLNINRFCIIPYDRNHEVGRKAIFATIFVVYFGKQLNF